MYFKSTGEWLLKAHEKLPEEEKLANQMALLTMQQKAEERKNLINGRGQHGQEVERSIEMKREILDENENENQHERTQEERQLDDAAVAGGDASPGKKEIKISVKQECGEQNEGDFRRENASESD